MSLLTMKLLTVLWFILIYNIDNVAPLNDTSIMPFNLNPINILKFYTLQSNVELSDHCKKQSDIYYKYLLTTVWNKEEWPKKMMDASSKLQAGIYYGNLVDLGAFDECLGIDSGKIKIKGKYCLTKLKIPLSKNLETTLDTINKRPEVRRQPPPSFSQRWSICVPDGCTAKDVETHLNSYDKSIKFSLKENDCQTIESQIKLDSGDWTVIGIMIVLGCIIVLSTIYDIYLYYVQKDTIHPLFIAFSWFTNFIKLLKINNNPELLPCLNGIRALSILWIVHGHEYLIMASGTMFNASYVQKWMTDFWSLITLSSNVSVDSFFFLSGCLLMYGFLKAKTKKIPFNVPLYYIHRYLRLTPAFAAVVIFYATLFSKMGTGPKWESLNLQWQTSCKEYWWSSLLYIQNYANPENNCVGQSWYLSVDMQLYILAPLILIPIGKWPKLMPYILGILTVLSTITPTIVAWHYEIPAPAIGVSNFFTIYYSQIYTRAGPWLIGLILGYILFETKHKKYRMNKIVVTILWLITGIVMLYIIFGNYRALDYDFKFSKVYNSLYTGFHRNLWALGLSWIVFACVHGYGGPVNWILSLSVFQFFAKISYSIYLTHVAIQYYNSGVQRVPFLLTNFTILQSFFSTICLCTFISTIWVLCFESPFVIIDGVIIRSVTSLFTKRYKKNLKQSP